LLNAQKQPVGTRIFGPVTRELRTGKLHAHRVASAGGAIGPGRRLASAT
jgi:ribosomal protein L14